MPPLLALAEGDHGSIHGWIQGGVKSRQFFFIFLESRQFLFIFYLPAAAWISAVVQEGSRYTVESCFLRRHTVPGFAIVDGQYILYDPLRCSISPFNDATQKWAYILDEKVKELSVHDGCCHHRGPERQCYGLTFACQQREDSGSYTDPCSSPISSLSMHRPMNTSTSTQSGFFFFRDYDIISFVCNQQLLGLTQNNQSFASGSHLLRAISYLPSNVQSFFSDWRRERKMALMLHDNYRQEEVEHYMWSAYFNVMQGIC